MIDPAMRDSYDTPSAVALRVWEIDREHLTVRSFNATPAKPPAWWVGPAFATPAGGWPHDHPLVAECKAGKAHEPHEDDCLEDCEQHDPIPGTQCRCGIYGTRNLRVVSDYMRAAREPVLGIIEMGGRTIMGEPGHESYARSAMARLAAILLVDRSLSVDHETLRRLAAAYRVPALLPHSTNPDDFRQEITVTSALADETEQFLRRRHKES